MKQLVRKEMNIPRKMLAMESHLYKVTSQTFLFFPEQQFAEHMRMPKVAAFRVAFI